MSVGTTAAITLGVLGAAGSIGSAAIGAHAAGSAADKQVNAGNEVAGLALGQGDASNRLYGDFRDRILPALDDARDSARDESSRGVENAGVILNQERQASEHQAQFERERSIGLATPYENAGVNSLSQIMAGFQPGGEFNTKFTAENFRQLDPGFDFRNAEGLKAVQRSALARGSGFSGATAKALDRYSQDYASAEFGNAYNRFQSANQQRYSQLMGVTNLGQNAVNQDLVAGANSVDQRQRAGALFAVPQATNQVNLGNRLGDLSINNGQFQANLDLQSREAQTNAFLNALGIAGNAKTGAANAAAAGTIGSANAWAGGLSGTTDAISNAVLLSSILGRSSTAPRVNPVTDPLAGFNPYANNG